ncbi:MAG: phospho-sugar mutase [Acutalibacteraceae bacterium]
MTSESKYKLWLDNVEETDLKSELFEIQENQSEKYERFYKDLEFGTAGIRGIMGVGSNRMNIYTVRRVAQGLARYLLKYLNNPRVVISFDSRNNSHEFAKSVAQVLAANGITAYITQTLKPTPVLSFLVRKLGADAGVMITASHNPAEYNGLKCYGSDGAQMDEFNAKEVYDLIEKIDIFKDINVIPFEKGLKNNLIKYVDDSFYEDYIDMVIHQRINTQKISDLKVVYTPLNGTGVKFVSEVLNRCGVENLNLVESQVLPDGNFPTCPFPNPENETAFELAIDLAQKTSADLIIATDPDSDRLGACIQSGSEYKMLTGNEIGIILFYYIVSNLKNKGFKTENTVLIKSIVTTHMVNAIAKDYGVEVKEVLTGFKNIASEILNLERFGEEKRFIFGFEESNGYLRGTDVRDKDAVLAAMLLCEAASYYKRVEKKTLIDILDDLKKKYGFFCEKTISYEFKGSTGIEKIGNIMEKLRNTISDSFENLKIDSIEDYLTSKFVDMHLKKTFTKNLPKSDVVKIQIKGDNYIVVRPSGTEPKVKFYAMVYSRESSKAIETLSEIEKAVAKFADIKD